MENFESELASAKKMQELFSMCEAIGEGVHGKLHIIDNASVGLPDDCEESFRIYHGGGYCFDIGRNSIEKADESEWSNIILDGWVYMFSGNSFEGFKPININQAITLLKSA